MSPAQVYYLLEGHYEQMKLRHTGLASRLAEIVVKLLRP